MKKGFTVFMVLCVLFIAGVAQACDGNCGCGADGMCAGGTATASEADIKKALEALDPAIKVTAVTSTEDPGLYEVVYNDVNVIYYSGTSGAIYFGRAKGRDNLTAKRVGELRSNFLKDVDRLPLKGTVKIGSGPKKVIEFSDAECSYCRQMEPYFEGRKDVTRYIFMIPLAGHKDSPALTKHVLCQKDRAAAYKAVMGGKLDGGKTPEPAASCAETAEKQMAENAALAQKLGLSGTPLFFVDGEMVNGADRERLTAILGGKQN